MLSWTRRARLSRLRSDWGRAVPRTHRAVSLAPAHQARAEATGEAVVDTRTAADLDLDAVFRAIDRTTSTLGQQALYHRLHRLGSEAALQPFEALVSFFSRDTTARERAQLALTRLQDPHGYDVWWLGTAGAPTSRPWFAVFPLLTLLTLSSAVATVLWHLWPLLAIVLLVNLGVWRSAADHIGALGMALRQVAPMVATAADLGFLTDRGLPILEHLKQDVTDLHRLQTIARWLSGDPLMLSFRADGFAMIVTALATAAYEYVNLVLLLDANAVYFAGSELRARRGALLRLVASLGDVDAALSVASWRAERADWSRPAFRPGASAASLVDAKHPLLDDAVPNSLDLWPGRGILVTGSNMSGKSTLLRTVGVNAVLAQSLNTCLCSRYESPWYRVRSCIGRTDDLQGGKSYYQAEVDAVLGLVRAASDGDPHLFLFDELFRGTNTSERIGAADAVLRALVSDHERTTPHVVIVATHDGELVERLAGSYEPCHFSDRLGPDGLVFEYRLQPGPATTRNAIALLAQSGAPRGMVERALATAAEIDASRATSNLQPLTSNSNL
jgi:hypothetical protein